MSKTTVLIFDKELAKRTPESRIVYISRLLIDVGIPLASYTVDSMFTVSSGTLTCEKGVVKGVSRYTWVSDDHKEGE